MLMDGKGEEWTDVEFVVYVCVIDRVGRVVTWIGGVPSDWPWLSRSVTA